MTNGTFDRILHIKSGDNPGLVLENTGGGRHFLHTHSDGSFAILNDITGVEPLIITSAGNVGIGTTSPGDILHVKFPTGAENAVVIDTTDSSGNSAEPWLDFNSAGVNKFSLGWDVISNTFMISNSAFTSKFVLGQNGYLGLGGQDTTYPLSVSSGAHVTVGGVWTDASSRQYKENIVELTYDNALTTLKDLTPVTYNYKVDKEDSYVGFIAEDVPELVSRKDRKSLSPMDIVAVLTKVVQKQQEITEKWQNEMKKLNSKLKNVDQGNVELKTENNLLREELVLLKDRQNALEAMFLVGTDVKNKKLAKFCDKTKL